jgi:phosphate transport system protein
MVNRGTGRSMASVANPGQVPSRASIRDLTLRAGEIARAGCELVSREIPLNKPDLLNRIRQYEEELDHLNRLVNEGIVEEISGASEPDIRELLACLKFLLELERIGDLLLNVVNRGQSVSARLEKRDLKDLAAMAGVLTGMLVDALKAFADRDLNRVMAVLKADAEVDRLRNLIFLRHIENQEGEARSGSFHLLYMTQSLERVGDHVKNLVGEVCQLITGHSVRHLVHSRQQPAEHEKFLEWLRRRQGSEPDSRQ